MAPGALRVLPSELNGLLRDAGHMANVSVQEPIQTLYVLLWMHDLSDAMLLHEHVDPLCVVMDA